MPKGKVAVIEMCSKCPYKAFDSTIELCVKYDEIAYCGCFKPLDPTKLRIEKYLKIDGEGNYQPEDCPLPDGNDFSKWRNIVGEDNTGKFPNSTDF